MRFLVALQRGKGPIERAPVPVGILEVLTLMRRLVPYQTLHVSVLPDLPKEEEP